MSLFSWLLALGHARSRLRNLEREIEEKKRTVEENDKGIEAIQPMVDEAIRRTDDGYYTLRHRVASAVRRKDKAETDAFMRDLKVGWRRRE